MNKIRHHPILILQIMWFLWAGISIGLGMFINLWFYLLVLPGCALYFFWISWEDTEILICPECGYEPSSKSTYYCGKDGTRLVFRRKVKVTKGWVIPKRRIPVSTCSKGHEINTFDKFCPKCGEILKAWQKE